MTVDTEPEDYLAHYGILRRSGRYPWGSGDSPAQRSETFISTVAALRKQGMTDTEIARSFSTAEHPFTLTDLRNTTTIARAEKRASDQAKVQRMHDKGMSNIEIGKQLGINESSVRSLRAAADKDKEDVTKTVANLLRDKVAEKQFIDIGAGVEINLGITSSKLSAAVSRLKDEGYVVHPVKIDQAGTSHKTEFKVLCPPGTTQKEAWMHRNDIQQIQDFSEDGGRSFLGIHPPRSINSKRVGIRYGEEGGAAADGVIYVRRGVKDVSLGNKNYAQVRVMVDGSHYLKGIAMYKDDMPEGVDLLFNTPKSNTGNKHDVMKPIKDEPNNPFGSTIRQLVEPGAKKPYSVMNIVGSPTKEGSGEEGSWGKWSKNLSSQFLSKQSPTLAKQQLNMTFENTKANLDEIMHLTNPVVRKKMLLDFAEEVDKSAVHLKAAQLPRQSTHLILPLESIKENEIYAPNFRNGERVVLIRHPHGGTFEIPELTVNNNHPEGKRLLGQTEDAVGIHPKAAHKLSGADFDGDTVIVIPNNSGKVRATPSLKELQTFDAKREFPPYDGMPTIDGGKYNAKTKSVDYVGSPTSRKQTEMGNISNLITDMTIQRASHDEIAQAVRHSMVVIDAEKHMLNFKESAKVNNIPALKAKYQGRKDAGASTLISRAKSEKRVPERKQGFRIDPTTGEKIFFETGRTVTTRSKTGKEIITPRTTITTKLAEAKDAHTLVSKDGGTVMERIYADHSNRLKAMANDVRKEAVNTKGTPYSPSARHAFAKEVASLDSKLNIALKNAPLERQAQVIAARHITLIRQANPGMEKDALKKVKTQAIIEARTRTGAGKQAIEITDHEWQAIQAGAVTNSRLSEILKHANPETVKQLATPKRQTLMTSAKTSVAKGMIANGYTQAQIADALGVSLSTLKRSLGDG